MQIIYQSFLKRPLLLLFQYILIIEIIVNFFIYIFFSWTKVRDIYGKCITRIIKYISCDNEHEVLPEWSRLILYHVTTTPSPVHIMIYSRHRYNEVVKSIFSVVKVAHYRRFQQANWRQLWSIPCHHLAPSLPLKNRGDCLGVAAINRCRYSRYMLQFSSRYFIYIYTRIDRDFSWMKNERLWWKFTTRLANGVLPVG